MLVSRRFSARFTMDFKRELLFGVFAVQHQFIKPSQFNEAWLTCAVSGVPFVTTLLQEHRWLTVTQKDELDELVEQELLRHEGNVAAALSLVEHEDIRQMLLNIDEPRIQDILKQLPSSSVNSESEMVTFKPLPETVAVDLGLDPTLVAQPNGDADSSDPTAGEQDDADDKSNLYPPPPRARCEEHGPAPKIARDPTPAQVHFSTPEETVDQQTSRELDAGGFVEGLSFIAQDNPAYTLNTVYGEGGLGRVWRARDSQLNRDVALKVLRPRHSKRPDVLMGFLKEAQITGQLEHPGIVPVYQVGRASETGQPFYTMRLVHGQTLSDAIKQFHHRQRSGERDPLEQRRLLGAFTAVCNAIAYAHSRGVLHRDLKPDNVVLGDFGEVIVLDWGLAKLAGEDDTQQTRVTLTEGVGSEATLAGAVMGTPAFMAPEQAKGNIERIGPQTDVYGLGGILFNLLTGAVPHRGKMVRKVLQDITIQPTPSPKSADPSVPAPLDAVVMKAMAKFPDERYSTATELAKDVECWLADEPVSVYREPWLTRAARWARRHKTWVAGTAVLLVTAVLGLSVSTLLIRREQQRTETARQLAVHNFQQARDAVDYMLTKFGQDKLADVPEMQLFRQDLLEKALSFYLGFLKENPEDPSVQADTARAYHRVAEISRLLERHADAQQAYEKAIDLFQSLADQFPNKPENRQLLATSHNFRGELFRATGELEQAESAYVQAQQIQQALSQQFPNVADYRLELARTFYNLGLIFHASNRMQPAENAHNQAIGLLQRLVDSDSQSEPYRQELARARINLGMVLRSAGRSKDAEHAYQRAIELLGQLVDQSPAKREYRQELGTAYMNLGNLLLGGERSDDTKQAYLNGLQQFETLVRDFPNVPLYRYEWANSVNGLGSFYYFDKEPQRAENQWRQALEQFQTLATRYPTVPDYQSRVGAIQGNLGSLLLDRNKILESIRFLQEAIQHQRAALESNPDSPSYREFLRNNYWGLSRALNRNGQHADAAQAAAELPKIIPDGWQEYYRAAGLVAQCIAVVAKDTTLAEVQRAKIEQRYADQAVEFLGQAVRHGFNDADDMHTNQSLKPLNEHPEFMRLLDQLRKAN